VNTYSDIQQDDYTECNKNKGEIGMSFKKLLAFLCLTLSLSVTAAPIEYTVTGEMTGTFTFDPTTNAYTDVSLILDSQFIWTLSDLSFGGDAGYPIGKSAAKN
jgi:hypothetical protein